MPVPNCLRLVCGCGAFVRVATRLGALVLVQALRLGEGLIETDDGMILSWEGQQTPIQLLL